MGDKCPAEGESVPSLPPTPQPRGGLAESRLLSTIEFATGAFFVVGHNVLRALPNEVPILAALGLLSVRLREGGWAAIGLKRPSSWRHTVMFALGAAMLRVLLGEFVVAPITGRFWPPTAQPAAAGAISGHPGAALLALLFVWTFAAFGEEIAYRGYLIQRAADVGRRSAASYLVAMVLVSVLFGYGHYSKGPSGIVDSGMAGLVLGAAYLLSGRNLWVAILAHGMIDTYAVVVIYLGWAG
jgi:uncharacterized protein